MRSDVLVRVSYWPREAKGHVKEGDWLVVTKTRDKGRRNEYAEGLGEIAEDRVSTYGGCKKREGGVDAANETS